MQKCAALARPGRPCLRAGRGSPRPLARTALLHTTHGRCVRRPWVLLGAGRSRGPGVLAPGPRPAFRRLSWVVFTLLAKPLGDLACRACLGSQGQQVEGCGGSVWSTSQAIPSPARNRTKPPSASWEGRALQVCWDQLRCCHLGYLESNHGKKNVTRMSSSKANQLRFKNL